MSSITGKIIQTKACSSSTYIYWIKTADKRTEKFTYFARGGPSESGLDGSREVTFNYRVRSDPRYGDSKIILDPVTYGHVINDIRLIRDFLVNRIELTKSITDKLIDKFGEQTMKTVLENPKVILELKGNKAALETAVKQVIKHRDSSMDAVFFGKLSELGVEAKYHKDVRQKLVPGPKHKMKYVREHIYDLYLKVGVPYVKVDTIAMKLGYDKNCDSRIMAFAKMLYKEKNQEGLIYLSAADIDKSCKKFDVSIEKVLPILYRITINAGTFYTTEEIHQKELFVENICSTLAKQQIIDATVFVEAKYIQSALVDKQQRIAIKNALENCISIITGPPGSGKSYVIGHICAELCLNTQIFILAPTGAAVERLRNENTISDIQKREPTANKPMIRTLQSFIYTKNEAEDVAKKQVTTGSAGLRQKTLYEMYDDYDEFVFVIDEMSMVDINLFHAFMLIVSKVLEKVRLIIVGDKNQLPSIEGGYVLNDLIVSGKISVVYLQGRHRQKPGAAPISENAELVLNGADIEPDGKAFDYIKIQKASEAETTLENVLKTNGIEPANSCILIPFRKAGICTTLMNPMLQQLYNPLRDIAVNTPFADFKYRVGDKIIHGKNNAIKGVYNGSILWVKQIVYDNDTRSYTMKCSYCNDETKSYTERTTEITYKKLAKQQIIQFADFVEPEVQLNKTAIDNFENDLLSEEDFEPEDDDSAEKIITYSTKNESNANDLLEDKVDLAYAMTIHKAQGKGYDTVVIILHNTMFCRMLHRNMLYTAITRAKQKCIIIGDDYALEECKKLMEPRITFLFKNIWAESMFDLAMELFSHIHRCVNSAKLVKALKKHGVRTELLADSRCQRELHKIFGNASLLESVLTYLRSTMWDPLEPKQLVAKVTL